MVIPLTHTYILILNFKLISQNMWFISHTFIWVYYYETFIGINYINATELGQNVGIKLKSYVEKKKKRTDEVWYQFSFFPGVVF